MFKKALKKLNNAKGFTLVELLAVIVILGIIVAIAVPAIGGIIDNARNDANDAEDEMILEAARLANAAGDITGNTTVNDLITEGYLVDEDVDRPGTDSIFLDNGEYTFTNPTQ
ncbi:competence type IV pilus major pilin ComGC [Aquibacillus kalidii]|uniref:competence type IV pilus major pilin ComGC n=1 Tax=Aquibacillus kalidii TaxID=2762597 RepID=UPI001646F6FD|nr:type II secretion system protein [Aquibacillus kalidii]